MFPCGGEDVENKGVLRIRETSSCSDSRSRVGHRMHHRRCFPHNALMVSLPERQPIRYHTQTNAYSNKYGYPFLNRCSKYQQKLMHES